MYDTRRYCTNYSDVDGTKLALMGMSLGGYFAARAVAFEHRLRAAIFFDGVYDFNQSIRGALPKEAITALDAGDMGTVEAIVQKQMPTNTSLRWAITQGVWAFGASSLSDFITKSAQLSMKDVVGQVQCPCLVLEGAGDMFFASQPKQIYDALQVPRQLFTFMEEDGAENHCQCGAMSYKDEVVFNWLDETLKLHDGRAS